MNDQHVLALTAIVQIVLLAVNAALIAWYLWETRKLRRAAEDQVTKSQSQASAAYEQVEAMRHQAAIAQDQREAQIRPALTVSGKSATLLVVNIGNGPALNLQLVKGRRQTVLPASSRIETNFGMRVKGSFVAPGESQAKDTNEKVGSIGQLDGEDLQLVYESLSGKKYVSIVEFDGPGNPCKTTFHFP
jgi:hypothetical protein